MWGCPGGRVVLVWAMMVGKARVIMLLEASGLAGKRTQLALRTTGGCWRQERPREREGVMLEMMAVRLDGELQSASAYCRISEVPAKLTTQNRGEGQVL